MTSITHHNHPTPRALLEALAAIAIIASLPPEQEAYERWLDEVDYRGPWPQIPWDELSDETQMHWLRRIRGVRETNVPPNVPPTCTKMPFVEERKIEEEMAATCDKTFLLPGMTTCQPSPPMEHSPSPPWKPNTRAPLPSKPPSPRLSSAPTTINPLSISFSSPVPTPSPNKATTPRPPRPRKEWIATSLGNPEVKNRPKCPLCTSLKKSTPCKGGPPCSECSRKGYSAEECRTYVAGQGNKGRRRRPGDGVDSGGGSGDGPPKRVRVRSKLSSGKGIAARVEKERKDVEQDEVESGSGAGEGSFVLEREKKRKRSPSLESFVVESE